MAEKHGNQILLWAVSVVWEGRGPFFFRCGACLGFEKEAICRHLLRKKGMS
ncbi:hypothetical protein [Desulfobotulus alkaliphilus]|uniref:hypothetical protein n=1 Tax=Desulfobotulus alkaliphilus TaxID=622671 RepID=UPI0016451DC7|nr:hypothetical protein [Desulfobotulus alkaliphilus]